MNELKIKNYPPEADQPLAEELEGRNQKSEVRREKAKGKGQKRQASKSKIR